MFSSIIFECLAKFVYLVETDHFETHEFLELVNKDSGSSLILEDDWLISFLKETKKPIN